MGVPGGLFGGFVGHLCCNRIPDCDMIEPVACRDADDEAKREIPVQFLCGIQVKNKAYKGPQGKVVLTAWVNLEAGL